MLREAMLLERAGRLPEAEAAYERLLARWPDLPDSWYNLAVLQRRARRFDAALTSYQQALDRGVRRPEEVHLNRGVIYSDCLRQEDAAERELHTALALNPDYVPGSSISRTSRRTLANGTRRSRSTKESWRSIPGTTKAWRVTRNSGPSRDRTIR